MAALVFCPPSKKLVDRSLVLLHKTKKVQEDRRRKVRAQHRPGAQQATRLGPRGERVALVSIHAVLAALAVGETRCSRCPLMGHGFKSAFFPPAKNMPGEGACGGGCGRA